MKKWKNAVTAAIMSLSLTVMSGCSLLATDETKATEPVAPVSTTQAPETTKAPATTVAVTEQEPTTAPEPTTEADTQAPAQTEAPTTQEPTQEPTIEETEALTEPTTEPAAETPKKPKYIFLFIGDGMGIGHIQAASYYKAAVEGGKNYDPAQTSYAGSLLNFEQFPVVGSVVNYNGDSFITDSAAAITAITTGHKTATDAIGVNADGTERYETIAEKVKSRLGFKVGVVSNANINHATPAGYYGHQVNRTMYYELGLDMLASGFDYLGGGTIRQPAGADGAQADLYELAKTLGYKVYRDKDAALSKLNESMGRVLITSEQRGEGDAMKLRIDAEKGSADLADYVLGGLKVLGEQQGFFFGIEGGLIDWAAHENDAGSVVREVLDLEKAVGVALEFYKAHPEETLILVTADHEIGGMGLGYSNMGYELYLQGLKNQKLSYRDYMVKVALEYRPQGTDWETVLWEIRSLFGLTFDATFQGGDDPKLKMTNDEVLQLHAAYLASMKGETATYGTAMYENYGSYEPLAFSVTTILEKKCGVRFTTVYHTGAQIPIYAIGAGAEEFSGTFDNTEIAKKIEKLLGID